jgi:hypothetical protein
LTVLAAESRQAQQERDEFMQAMIKIANLLDSLDNLKRKRCV